VAVGGIGVAVGAAGTGVAVGADGAGVAVGEEAPPPVLVEPPEDGNGVAAADPVVEPPGVVSMIELVAPHAPKTSANARNDPGINKPRHRLRNELRIAFAPLLMKPFIIPCAMTPFIIAL